MNLWLDLLRRYGLSSVMALVLLWFVLETLADAIKSHDRNMQAVEAALREHDHGTIDMMQKICVNTAVMAKRDPADCFRP